ncbi:MAG TPA: cellulase family glycosylhydrolase, partial [Candidatus Kapabacteria bacterium]|nr:cellulase family glycosylhydrolase [Candidatus Kapabacteria bacterium]
MKTFAIFFLLFCTLPIANAQPFQRSFPTPMPMDSVIRHEYLFGKFNAPITVSNALTVKDGHFFTTDGKRVRLIGTSLHNAACFPDSAMAVAIARRLAGLGFNAVRLVGIDNQWWRNYGSVFAEANDTKNFDAQQMKKLDRLIVELQKNGVYVVLQLYSQWMPRADDNIPAYDSVPWNGRYVNFFVPQVIDRIRNYAVKLCNHRNSITNIPYKDDPTIACIELTDDNSLFGGWSNGLLHPGNDFSFTHSALLDAVWNNYLFNKY